MKLKHLRRTIMNSVMEQLRKQSPLPIARLFNDRPDTSPIGSGTVLAAFEKCLEELVERDFLQVWPAGTWKDDEVLYYELSDRMFDATGDVWIGHTLIDPEWPDDWMVKK